ncbi:FadR/GntR family transcriptional regulator [Sporosarcina highlanderae]|uniref:GntR family transcriptional regulator n=1 Tax=Sporosarcina highlanderae TaxID=3035916 RepID=A0ABT8JQ84_9BACL|nr:GntR family transcriptional regulator [Sporosarcina highlanderae]MDN4607298.1 GntR family transcriptional regulator [Sporosarcina highlanderae]
MQNTKPTSKMFLDIVGELRLMIKAEGIEVGDKLPSERVLAERLQVGRSTVREALRSLELLGLIETRRGEGTFLADFKKHQLVEVLSPFIMQQTGSAKDARDTRIIHEKAAIQSICSDSRKQKLPVWKSLLMKLAEEGSVLREDIVREMIVATDNRLSLKIWFLLKQYSRVPYGKMTEVKENQIVSTLLEQLIEGHVFEALNAYERWIEEIEGEE